MSPALLDPSDDLRFGPELARYEPYVFTGTRTRPPWRPHLTPDEIALVERQVDELPSNALVMTGGARGVAAIVNRRAAARDLMRLALLPAVITWVDWESIAGALVVRTRMTPVERDRTMVRATRHCIVIGLYEPGKDPRSGTWATARAAQSCGVLSRTIILRPKFTDHPVVEEGNDVCVCHPAYCGCVLGRACNCGHHPHHNGQVTPPA